MGRVRNSSCAGQSMNYVSVLGAFNSFVGGWVDFGCNVIYYCIYPKCIFLLIICNFYMFFTFFLVYVSVFVCLFVHQCVVAQLSVSHGNLNVFFMRPSNNEGSQLFKFHFPCNKGERRIYILSLESATSVQKPTNLLKVAYHPVSCLLLHYTL